MRPTFHYLVMGSGQQGLAAAYDLIRHGGAKRLTLVDGVQSAAVAGALKLKKLLPAAIKRSRVDLVARSIDVRNRPDLIRLLRGHDAILSAVPYYLNPLIAKAAIQAKVHYADLGGYFESTRAILQLGPSALKAGVTLIPDCGVAPGLCNSLAACGVQRLDRAKEVHIYCGGLPQHPRPPLNYKIVFNLEGVLGNYFGDSFVLKNGRVTLVPSFSGREMLSFGPPLGRLEARTTGGATSTAPWTFRGTLKAYDSKTLRYPGHYDKVEALQQLGLLETRLVRVKGTSVAPRDVFVAAAGPRLAFPDDRDLLVMRVIVKGRLKGRAAEVTYDLLDFGDAQTGFTAMQRTTGFSAALIVAFLAEGVIFRRGVVPLERAVEGRLVLEGVRARGLKIREMLKRRSAKI